MGVTFTEEQQRVIDLRDRNILVSAAAGSGKTAVLVERIITRLTKDASPIDVDQLLIVTYTEAAAAEMKERIRNAIEKALEEHPDNEHLQRQATLIHHAQVTTIHSFCLSVIRDYFHTIDLDPGFRIGEEGELKLLKRDVLEEVLESWYQNAAPSFLQFVESFATGRDDRNLEDLILQLYEYSRSYPNPEKWLNGCEAHYDIPTKEALEEAGFVKQILTDVKKIAEDLVENLMFAKEVCMEEDGPKAYMGALDADIAFLMRIRGITTYEQAQQLFAELKWEKLASNRDKTVSEGKIELVKSVREECKKMVDSIRADYFYDSMDELQTGMYAAKSNMKVLVNLVKDFARVFSEKKQSKNMIDFGDMEHYALHILTREEGDAFVPSAAAKEYQQKFKEVMIDEYQDSNYIQEAILTSVSTVSQKKYNVFMVGDVKQSIYRFRLSRPELFMEKYHTYSLKDGLQQRIDLHKNFRSRREVLDSTNFIFKQIMTEGFGGITYDDEAALNVGAAYEEQPGNETEICFVDISELPEEWNKREVEALAVAREIQKMVGCHPVLDKKTGTYRPARYSDIVVLTRSLKGFTDTFLKIFKQEGIPAYSISKEGYFETREIQMLLDYLRILDNPRQDIPFVAVLTSPFAALTSEELAILKNESTGKTFYEKVCTYQENGADERLREKLQAFLTQYEAFRRKVPYTAIHTLLWSIIEDTGYGNYVAAMPAGEQRAANLEMLIEKAVSFESTSYKGLFHFVRYIDELHKYDVDYGEANIIDEASDIVSLMSIHKSKGLEFPIVFVVGMDKLFNMQDTRSNVVLHPELGVGIDFVDIERRERYPSLLKRMIQKEVQRESVAEELRVLYVAMTRAKEKLILMGTVSNMEGRLMGCAGLRSREKAALPYTKLTRARRYFDWIIPALYRNQALAPVLEFYGVERPFQNSLFFENVPIQTSVIDMNYLISEEAKEMLVDMWTSRVLENWDTNKVYDSAVKNQLREQFAFQYAYQDSFGVKPKLSVSELKRKAYMEEGETEEVIYPLLPRFMQEETGLTGASRGTVYHKVLEMLDFTKEYDMDSLKEELDCMVKRNQLTEQEKACVRRTDIIRFLASSIGKRVVAAAKRKQYHKEQPFVLGRKLEAEELTLIQGIIDGYFEEEGELVVLDYKTDRVSSVWELRERYDIQLEYYAKALEQVLEKTVKEKIIYSFALQEEIRL